MDTKPYSKEKTEKSEIIPMVSTILDDQIVETIYDPEKRETTFAVWRDSAWTTQPHIQIDAKKRLVPYSGSNNLIESGVVLFPSEPEEYGSEEELLQDIQSFIHRYVDVTPLFEKIASYYVLFSWVYDCFNELPYLRLRGEPGSGKTRFLLTVGSLCYKPVFASGASTLSPIFRILDAFRGTLIIDESDFRMSDEKAEIVKIFNNGNTKGFPVLRSEVIAATKEFNPRAYAVYGPKIVATRGHFDDRALESRFLTEEMGQHRLRENIPINLPGIQQGEALHLRNKLLLFRFRNLGKCQTAELTPDRSIEPRLSQIFTPLLSIVKDQKTKDDLQELARSYNRQMAVERSMDTAANLLEIIRELMSSPGAQVSIKEITSIFIERHQDDYERKITSKWIGSLVRNKLNLKTQKSHGVFIISQTTQEKLEHLYERYGLSSEDSPIGSLLSPQVHPVDSNPIILDLSKPPQSLPNTESG